MKGKLSKLFYCLIVTTMVMVGTDIGVFAQTSNPQMRYEIYPTVHDISYKGNQYELEDQVNLVLEEGIDTYTFDHIVDVLGIKGITLTATDHIVTGKQNVLIGIYGSDGVVDEYFKKLNISDATLFEKYDSHMLSIQDGTIAILGKDTDSAFYGVTTLKHILNQVEARTIENLLIKDYSEIQYRGFIEGYYGNPWSYEDRNDLMEYGGDYKLNQYIFAPKDDPYHNEQWRVLYPEDALKKISELAETGRRTKNQYVYTIHPFMHNGIRFDENYENDLDLIKAKFTQLMENGVRHFGILADDAGAASYSDQVRMLEDMTQWLETEQQTYPDLNTSLFYCPAAYYYFEGGLKELNMAPDSVNIVSTGGTSDGLPRIWGSVYDAWVNEFIKCYTSEEKAGRAPYIWVNWPCSDNSKDRLIMGGNERFLVPGQNPKNIRGIVLNPMQQSEANKSALFAVADYAWNMWETVEDAQKNWQDSFTYMDHGTAAETESSIALRELSRHMKNSNTGIPESEELSPKLNDFTKLLEQDQDYVASAEALIAEFTQLKQYATYYKAHPGNERTMKQLLPWWNCWEDTMDAGVNLLKAAIAIKHGESTEVIWDYYSTGQAALEKSQTYEYFYVDHMEHAVIGKGAITPFIKKLESSVGTIVSSLVNPNIQITTLITSRTDTPVVTDNKPAIDALTDGKVGTEVVWQSPNATYVGDYVGLRYTKKKQIKNITFQMGTKGNPRDTFAAAKIQYTIDGNNWMDLEGSETDGIPTTISAENLDLNVLGIRLIATKERGNMWLACREIEINKEPVVVNDTRYPGTITYSKPSDGAGIGMQIYAGSEQNLVDGDVSTSLHLKRDPYEGEQRDTTPAGAWIQFTLGETPQPIGQIQFLQDGNDKITQALIEYTENGTDWQELQTLTDGKAELSFDATKSNIKATAIRIRNLTTVSVWWKICEFEVHKPDENKINYNVIRSSEWGIYQGAETNLYDGDDHSYVYYRTANNDTSLAGEYIGYDFGESITIQNIHAVIGNDENAKDKWASYQLEYSNDQTNWTALKTYNGAQDQVDVIDEDFQASPIQARYIRFKNLKNVNKWLYFSEITINNEQKDQDELTSDYIYTNISQTIKATHTDFEDSIKNLNQFTLQPGEYIGFQFPSIKDIETVNYGMTSDTSFAGVVSQISDNAIVWNETTMDELHGRYTRLINTADHAVTFNLLEYTVIRDEISAPYLKDSDVGINASWGVSEDTRDNGAAFDGDINTNTEFADFPQQGQYIIYDLGQTRDLFNLKIYQQDNALNYIRDANIYVSEDGETWGDPMITIGDGVENLNDGGVSAMQSGLYQTSSTYPNKVYAESIEFSKKARYLKIEFTAANNNRAVVFNEIVLNNGEYVPTINDPTFVSTPIEVQGFAPQNLIDGDLTSSYKPNTKNGDIKEGSLLYRLSEHTDTKKINILQSGATISDAKVIARGYKHGEKIISQAPLGTLDKTLNELINYEFDHIFEIEILWQEIAPTLQEIILFEDYEIINGDATELINAYETSREILESSLYTTTSFASFTSAMKQAEQVIQMPVRTQSLIDSTLKKLNEAKQGLVEKAANIEAFVTLYEQIIEYDQNDFAVSTWNAFQQARETSKIVYDAIHDKVQSEVDDAYANLQSSVDELVHISTIKEKQAYLANAKATHLESDYTKVSYQNFIKTIEKYEAILADLTTIRNQSFASLETEVTTALDALLDLRPLKQAIETASKNYGESAYESSAWIKYQSLLKEARAILEKADATAEEITKAMQSCVDAQNVLTADALQALKNEVVRLSQLTNEDHGKAVYSKGSFEELQVVIRDAKLYLDGNQHKEELSFAFLTELKDAEEALVDLRPFSTFMNNVASSLKEEDYTKASWMLFQSEMAKGMEALAKEDVTKEELDTNQANITKAQAVLVSVRALKDALQVADAIQDLSIYTKNSAHDFEIAKQAAKALLEKVDATSEMIKEGLDHLTQAQANLLVKADDDQITSIMDTYQDIIDQKDLFTEESYEKFFAAYQALDALREDENATQANAEEAIAKLETAYAALKKIIRVANDDMDVSIEGTNDELPGNVELVVKEIDKETIEKELSAQLPSTIEHVIALDITLLSNGVEIQPNGTIKVRIRIPESIDKERLALYHVGDKIEELVFVIDGDYIVFETDHFSIYAMVNMKEQSQTPVVPQPTPDTPSGDEVQGGVTTGDTSNLLTHLMIMIGAGLVLGYARKRSKQVK